MSAESLCHCLWSATSDMSRVEECSLYMASAVSAPNASANCTPRAPAFAETSGMPVRACKRSIDANSPAPTLRQAGPQAATIALSAASTSSWTAGASLSRTSGFCRTATSCGSVGATLAAVASPLTSRPPLTRQDSSDSTQARFWGVRPWALSMRAITGTNTSGATNPPRHREHLTTRATTALSSSPRHLASTGSTSSLCWVMASSAYMTTLVSISAALPRCATVQSLRSCRSPGSRALRCRRTSARAPADGRAVRTESEEIEQRCTSRSISSNATLRLSPAWSSSLTAASRTPGISSATPDMRMGSIHLESSSSRQLNQ
mmetsp:Transcript_26951/g.62067  ORF Transcript_26951/g.62067 Transcript_26951/m.62067 type:complete len:320 (+) Transcript_26951:1059-2018(+)